MTVEDKTSDARWLALHFLQMGVLTQTEAALLAGVTRQAIHQWVRAAGIEPASVRKRHLHGLWKAYSDPD